MKPDIVSAHGKTREEFVTALVDAYHITGLTPRTATLRLGAAVYPLLLRSEIDGPHTTLGGIGWVELALDETMDPWHARIDARAKEGA